MPPRVTGDPRLVCDECGSRQFNCQQLGPTLTLFCDGECQYSVLGTVELYVPASIRPAR